MTREETIDAVLERFGHTHCEDLKIDLKKATPSALFRLLCFSLLSSARISHQAAFQATRALFEAGWTTAQKMSHATWRERTDVLNRSGYARYDESTSRYLGDTSQLLLEKYQGDLNRLREEAQRDLQKERKLLKDCKGIGDVGADIFFREVQAIWDEVYPFVDERTVKAAKQLNLPTGAKQLSALVKKEDFPRLVAGLVKIDLDKAYEKVQVVTHHA